MIHVQHYIRPITLVRLEVNLLSLPLFLPLILLRSHIRCRCCRALILNIVCGEKECDVDYNSKERSEDVTEGRAQ